MQNSKTTIGVVGLGYVGLPLAVEFGRKRHVIGFDTNDVRIEELSKGLDRTLETTDKELNDAVYLSCLLYTSPSPRDAHESRMPSSA